jgi:predicted PurR-regulated permease PerM
VLVACVTALFVVLLGAVLWKAPFTVALTVIATLLAIAVNHAVEWLTARRCPRGGAIAVVMCGLLAMMAAIVLVVAPPAVKQAIALVQHAPALLERAQETHVYEVLNRRLDLDAQLRKVQAPELASSLATHALGVVSKAAEILAAVVTVFFVTLFMLLEGGGLVQAALREAVPERRDLYGRIVANVYRSLGGYLGGELILCLTNATVTTVYAAAVGLPYFLPLGVLSGVGTLIPFLGTTLTGTMLTLVALATGSPVLALVTLALYLVYQQFENNVLSPMVFRQTIRLNPLVCIVWVLLVAELWGLKGAVLAVPLLAVAQIILGELLAIRRQRLLDRPPPG